MKLSKTKSAILRRKQRATETQSEKKARLKRRYDAVARFEALQSGIPAAIRKNLTHERWKEIKKARRERVRQIERHYA